MDFQTNSFLLNTNTPILSKDTIFNWSSFSFVILAYAFAYGA